MMPENTIRAVHFQRGASASSSQAGTTSVEQIENSCSAVTGVPPRKNAGNSTAWPAQRLGRFGDPTPPPWMRFCPDETARRKREGVAWTLRVLLRYHTTALQSGSSRPKRLVTSHHTYHARSSLMTSVNRVEKPLTRVRPRPIA